MIVYNDIPNNESLVFGGGASWGGSLDLKKSLCGDRRLKNTLIRECEDRKRQNC